MEIKTPFLNFRDRFIERRLAPLTDEQYAKWKADLEAEREALRGRFKKEQYEREDLAWYRNSVLEHFTFMYDTSFYEPGAGYKIDEFLDHGQREFGGYDIVVLWHAYPRIGCDDRNQFDFYRDMPGGLAGLRRAVDHLHKRGVKAFIDYNPWDTGTRREAKPDHEALAEIVGAIDADGIYLDTMSAGSGELRQAVDAARPGVVFETEGSPSFEAAEFVTGSWGQFNPWFGSTFFWHREHPFFSNTHLTMRWLDPRHSTRVIERHSHHRTLQLYPAFFNGAGAVVWENVFGWWNPVSPADRKVQRRIVAILRNHREAFQDTSWQPLVPSLYNLVMVNEWKAPEETVWTLISLAYHTVKREVLAVPQVAGARYFDAWNDYAEITVRTEGGKSYIPLTIDARSAGCIVMRRGGKAAPGSSRATPGSSRATPGSSRATPASYKARVESGSNTFPQTTLENNKPKPVAASAPFKGGALPDGMAAIPGATYEWKVEHRPWEGACYDDISHNWANTHPVRTVQIRAFLMDRHPVTNAQFKQFLDASGYKPKEGTNFLKHWVNGRIPAGKENHPVVYVDLTDARAYAAWAGKRLPTEEEWQYASQGTDGRLWPWGDSDPDGNGSADGVPRCNSDTSGTTPVDAFPGSESPFGVRDMIGNVWELTESERNDGHSRYVMLKGGSFYVAKGSNWYFDGGAQRCAAHGKFQLMWPGLDRCATIGFRCVKDRP